MRLLLDTHALLWWLADDPQLGAAARAQIADGANAVFVSAASAWEIEIKRARQAGCADGFGLRHRAQRLRAFADID